MRRRTAEAVIEVREESLFIDGHISKPVIANPPLSNCNIHNLHSSTSMPSGVSPMVILGTTNLKIGTKTSRAITCFYLVALGCVL